MAELKTQITDQNLRDFLSTIELKEKQSDAYVLLEMFEKATRENAVMWGTSIVGFGKYHSLYHGWE